MHRMERTPRIITIIGLVFEGLAGLTTGITALLINFIDKLPGYSASLEDLPADELEALEIMMHFLLVLLIVFAIVFSVMFVFNLILFLKLMTGAFTEKQAKKVYLYQAIWGGLNVLFNSVTGILYLVSGIQGYNGEVDRIETREGI